MGPTPPPHWTLLWKFSVFVAQYLHPLCFIRDSKNWRLVLSLKFFTISTSTVPYLSLIFLAKNHSPVPYKGEKQVIQEMVLYSQKLLGKNLFTSWINQLKLLTEKIWESKLILQLIFVEPMAFQLSLNFSKETSLCPLFFSEIWLVSLIACPL